MRHTLRTEGMLVGATASSCCDCRGRGAGDTTKDPGGLSPVCLSSSATQSVKHSNHPTNARPNCALNPPSLEQNKRRWYHNASSALEPCSTSPAWRLQPLAGSAPYRDQRPTTAGWKPPPVLILSRCDAARFLHRLFRCRDGGQGGHIRSYDVLPVRDSRDVRAGMPCKVK